ncbi:MAG: flagellar biosynthesis protein FlgD [Proteobacteria bacterium]|nr:MAG: flagellar biosynthesis protein FlgD [Pseudomonadota bacterium]
MSTIDPVADYAAQAGAAARAAKRADQLGINEFLHLMTVQLQNQDPMKPLDATEFVSQLAQFGSVSGIQSMQGSIESLAASLRSTQVLSGTSLVGREVLCSSNVIEIASGETVRGEVEVPEGASSVTIVVRDASGQVVRTMSAAPEPGLYALEWDGRDGTGAAVASGRYEIEVLANIGGREYSLESLLATRVDSVSIDAHGAHLTLNTKIGAFSLADVRRVL